MEALLAITLVHSIPHSLAADAAPTNSSVVGKRRALLVGIGKYDSARFPKLEYPPNDVARLAELLESPHYGFTVTKLTDDTPEKPTRENILKAIRKVLIEDAEAGDQSLFYFSGHGSSVRNSLSDEADLRDETIVPMDAVRPVKNRSDLKDIRDKEIAELFDQALAKKIKLTGIFDSCHSGSIARGDGQPKEVEEADFDIRSAPTDAQKIKPEDHGALIITAAEDYQQASGGTYSLNGHEAQYSHLTAELLQSLYQEPADRLSARDLFRRITARLTAAGRSQTPTIAGIAARMDENVFGDEVNRAPGKIRIPITLKHENGGRDALLAGGVTDGLADGVELRRIDPATGKETDPPLKIRVKRAGLSLSELEVLHGNRTASVPTPADKINPGDIFEQVTWVLKKEEDLAVWIPPATSDADLANAIAELSTLRKNSAIEILSEPDAAGQNTIYATQSAKGIQWEIRLENGLIEPLGRALQARQVLSIFTRYKLRKPRVLVNLPPSIELRKAMYANLSGKDTSIVTVEKREQANYVLTGRFSGKRGRTEYAWMLRSQLDLGAAPIRKNARDFRVRSLPPLTDWVADQPVATAAGELRNLALRLGNISGWLKLTSPINVGSLEFPYRLEIREHNPERASKTLAFGETMFADKEYELVLVADQSRLKNNNVLLPEFWIYVMNVDSSGKGSYINTGVSEKYGGLQNFDPLNPPQQISLSNKDGNPLKVFSPFGTELFILLVTDRPLDRSRLSFDGVRNLQGAGRGAFDPLENLLKGIGVEANARGYSSSPDTWAVQQLIMHSAERTR